MTKVMMSDPTSLIPLAGLEYGLLPISINSKTCTQADFLNCDYLSIIRKLWIVENWHYLIYPFCSVIHLVWDTIIHE